VNIKALRLRLNILIYKVSGCDILRSGSYNIINQLFSASYIEINKNTKAIDYNYNFFILLMRNKKNVFLLKVVKKHSIKKFN
jgi:hypothetical protein